MIPGHNNNSNYCENSEHLYAEMLNTEHITEFYLGGELVTLLLFGRAFGLFA